MPLLAGWQLKKLQAALIKAFPTYGDLEQMVWFGIDEDLHTITGEKKLQMAVFELLRWAQTEERLEELIQAALDQKGKNTELRRVAKQLGLLVNQKPSPQTGGTTPGSGSFEKNGSNKKNSEEIHKPSQPKPPNEEDHSHQERPFPISISWLKFLFTRRPGWALIGLLVLLTGVLWGASSRMIPHIAAQNVAEKYSYHVQNGNLHIYPGDNKATLFIVQCNDLKPYIDCTKIQGDINFLFLARQDTISVNDTKGCKPYPTQAHLIEELILSGVTYRTSNFNPDGTFDNRWWPGGFVMIGTGLLIACVALFVRRKPRNP